MAIDEWSWTKLTVNNITHGCLFLYIFGNYLVYIATLLFEFPTSWSNAFLNVIIGESQGPSVVHQMSFNFFLFHYIMWTINLLLYMRVLQSATHSPLCRWRLTHVFTTKHWLSSTLLSSLSHFRKNPFGDWRDVSNINQETAVSGLDVMLVVVWR